MFCFVCVHVELLLFKVTVLTILNLCSVNVFFQNTVKVESKLFLGFKTVSYVVHLATALNSKHIFQD